MIRLLFQTGFFSFFIAGLALTSSAQAQTFFTNDAPDLIACWDTPPVEVGMKWCSEDFVRIRGVRFFKAADVPGPFRINLWSANGQLLNASSEFTAEGERWIQQDFPTPLQLAPGTTYTAAYFTASGGYAYEYDYFSAGGIRSGNQLAFADRQDGRNGVYRYGGGFPTDSFRASNYFVDVVIEQTAPSPLTIFPLCERPRVAASTDTKPVELGIKFTPSQSGRILAVRAYRVTQPGYPARAHVWSSEGQLLGSGVSYEGGGSLPGWIVIPLTIKVEAGQTYVASYHAPSGGYAESTEYLNDAYTRNGFTVPEGGGVRSYGPAGTFPDQASRNAHYFVDIQFKPD